MSGIGSMPGSALGQASPTQRFHASGELNRWWGTMHAGWNWIQQHSKGLLARSAARRLRVTETVSLGEKRFVSILEVDGEQFLLGGSSSQVVLLAKLEGSDAERKLEQPREVSFAEVVSRASASSAAHAIVAKQVTGEEMSA